MKSSTKILLGVAAGGWFVSDLLKRIPQAIPKPPSADQLNGFIDPFALGLGCDCDLGFVGCADMGVAPARSGVGSLQRPHGVVWKKTSQRPDPRHWFGKNRKNFVLDGVGLAGFISPQTEARLDDPAAYPWGSTGYNSGYNDGLGKFSFKKAFQAAVAPVKKAVQVVAAPVKKVTAQAMQKVKKDLKTVEKVAVKMPVTALQAANRTIQQQISKAANVIKTETYLKPKAMFGGKKSSGSPEVFQDSTTGAIIYQDADGNVITKEEYDRQMSEGRQTPGIIPDYQDAKGNRITQEEYERQMSAVNADEATGGSAYNNMNTDAGGTIDSGDGVVEQDGVKWWQDPDGTRYLFDEPSQNWIQHQPNGSTNNSATASSPGDQNWRDRYGDGFITNDASEIESYNSGGNGTTFGADGVVYSNGVAWWQDTDGTWYWLDEQAGAWVMDADDGTYVSEVASTTDASASDVLFDDSDSLGHLYDRRNGRVLAVVHKKRGGASINPLKVDGKGRVFASNGRKHRQVGTVEKMAAAEGQAGLGFSLFGKSFAKFSDFAKDVASKATPSGAIYKLVKRRSPSKTKEFHKVVKTATPYVAIAAGTVLTVASLGTASPVGVALIVAGVAQAGAQGYSDIKSRQAAKAIEAINNQSAAEVAAISAGSPAQREAAALPDIEQERLNAASFGAQASEYSYPALNWAWWTGDLDEQSATTYGEQMQAAGL